MKIFRKLIDDTYDFDTVHINFSCHLEINYNYKSFLVKYKKMLLFVNFREIFEIFSFLPPPEP